MKQKAAGMIQLDAGVVDRINHGHPEFPRSAYAHETNGHLLGGRQLQ